MEEKIELKLVGYNEFLGYENHLFNGDIGKFTQVQAKYLLKDKRFDGWFRLVSESDMEKLELKENEITKVVDRVNFPEDSVIDLKLVGHKEFLGYNKHIFKGECATFSASQAKLLLEDKRFYKWFELVNKKDINIIETVEIQRLEEDADYTIESQSPMITEQEQLKDVEIPTGYCACGCGEAVAFDKVKNQFKTWKKGHCNRTKNTLRRS